MRQIDTGSDVRGPWAASERLVVRAFSQKSGVDAGSRPILLWGMAVLAVRKIRNSSRQPPAICDSPPHGQGQRDQNEILVGVIGTGSVSLGKPRDIAIYPAWPRTWSAAATAAAEAVEQAAREQNRRRHEAYDDGGLDEGAPSLERVFGSKRQTYGPGLSSKLATGTGGGIGVLLHRVTMFCFSGR